MKHLNSEGIDALANLLKAMGTPTRLQIIYLLAHEKVASVPTLKGYFEGLSNFVLYQNLTYLHKYKIIKKIRKGREIFYSLTDALLEEGLDLLSSTMLK